VLLLLLVDETSILSHMRLKWGQSTRALSNLQQHKAYCLRCLSYSKLYQLTYQLLHSNNLFFVTTTKPHSIEYILLPKPTSYHLGNFDPRGHHKPHPKGDHTLSTLIFKSKIRHWWQPLPSSG
jgi:hypothetical protein